MSRDGHTVSAGFPHLDLESALLLDFDELLLGKPSPALLAELATALQLLHGALDGAAIVLSGLAAAEIDTAFGERKLPVVASMGWERRWHAGDALDIDTPPSGVAEMYERLMGLVGIHDGLVIRPIPCGIEIDLIGAAEFAVGIAKLLHDRVDAAPGFRMLHKDRRYQIVPSNLRKDHAIDLLTDHSVFRRRQMVHVSDNLLAEDAARAVRRCGGRTLTVGTAGAHAPDARHWTEILNWLRRAEVSLSMARGHCDGF